MHVINAKIISANNYIKTKKVQVEGKINYSIANRSGSKLSMIQEYYNVKILWYTKK